MDSAERVLFVGDDELVRMAFADSLRSYGFNVDLADGLEITQYPSNGILSEIALSAGSTGMLATWTANYTPDDEFSGTDEVKFTVTNAYGTSSEATMSITINAVNDLPVLSGIDDVFFDEDGSATVTLVYSDVDSDVSISTSSDSNDVSLLLDGSLFIHTRSPNSRKSE